MIESNTFKLDSIGDELSRGKVRIRKTTPPTPRAPRKGRRPYIYDINTKNLSFIQTASDLHRLGIKNNRFFLMLYNERLVGVDPHSPHLTEEQIFDIINECYVNPWYFLRECVRIPDQGGTGIPYQLNRGNLASTFLYLLNIDHYLVLPRQIGKTMSSIAILLWSFIFGTSTSEFMFINKSLDDANNNLARLKAQRELLPPYLQATEIINEEGKLVKGTNNVKSISNPVNGNKIVTKPSATSKMSADNIGRGNTQPIQYYDEVEFSNHIKTIIQAAGPAFNTASQNAQRNGGSYCRIFTSTPGDLDSPAGKEASEIIETTCRWSEKLYDMTGDEIRKYVETNAKDSGIVYIEYTYTQLGKDEKWLDSVSRTLLYDQMKIKREVHLKRMHGSNSNPFSTEDIEALMDLKKSPDHEDIILNRFKLDIYEKIDRNRIYFIGIDCSTGVGVDNNALTIVDPYTEKPVAEFKSPYISQPDFNRLVYYIMKNYTPRGVLCIERNNVGSSLIQYLMETEFRNSIYYEQQDLNKIIDDKIGPDGFLKLEAHSRRIRGIYTGGESRRMMHKILEQYVHENKEKFVTENITSDISKLIIKGNRIDHGSGYHDDSLMSYLMVLYVLNVGKSLHNFGFVRGLTEEEKERGLIEEETENLYQTLNERYGEGTFVRDREEEERAKHEQMLLEARRRSQQMDMLINPNQGAINLDYLDDFNNPTTDIPLDFFDELNS